MRHKGMEGVGTKRRKKRWHKSQRYTSEERPGRARPLQKEKARRGNWRALPPGSGQARTAIIARKWRGVGGAGGYERGGIVFGLARADAHEGAAGSAISFDLSAGRGGE